MKVTKSKLKQIIKEELSATLAEAQPNFDNKTGRPLTAQGRAICAKKPDCAKKFLDHSPASAALGQNPPQNTSQEAGQNAQLLSRQWLTFYKALKAVSDDAGLGFAKKVKAKAEDFQNDFLQFIQQHRIGR